MFSIYDLSNHHCLFDSKNTTPHLFAIKLKLIVMKMICTLIRLIDGNMIPRLDTEAEKQALEIMILSSRLCLDSSLDCVEEMKEYQHCCDQLYHFYWADINPEFRPLHIINRLDLLRLTVDSPKFNYKIFLAELSNWEAEPCKKQYEDFMHYLVSEVMLKLLRKGMSLSECGPNL